MAPSYLLAIDQSTQSTKAFLVDRGGNTLAKASRPHRQIYPGPGLVEHDPGEILRGTREAVAQLFAAADAAEGAASGARPEDIAALCLTNQRETIVAWDAETGEPIHNALVWQDSRGATICRELEARGAGPLVAERTGLRLDPYFSASKLAWLVRNSEEAAGALKAGRLMAGTMDAWLLWNLSGRRVFATDYSNASRTMLFDIRRLAWDQELLALFGLQDIRLPEVRCSDADFGEAFLPALGRPLPVRCLIGDSHAALFGHRGWKPGDAKASYGTGSSIMVNIGPEPRPAPPGIVLSLAWGREGEASYVFEGNVHSTGYTMTWLMDQIGLFADEAEAERMASSLPDNGGVYLVPAFSGLGAPYWEQDVRALVTGLSHASDRRHVVRAGLESIAYQVRDLLEAMASGAPSPLSLVHVDGGPSANDFLMQFQADMLGMPVLAPRRGEFSALGAAYMAGLAIGFWNSPAELEALPAEERRFEPTMDEGRRAALLAGWQSAVHQTLARKVDRY